MSDSLRALMFALCRSARAAAASRSAAGGAFVSKDWSLRGLARLVAEQNRFALHQGNIVGQDFGRSLGFAVFFPNAGKPFSRHYRISAGVDDLLDKTYAEQVSRARKRGFRRRG